MRRASSSLLCLLLGCGASTTTEAPAGPEEVVPSKPGAGPQVHAEIGALDSDAVDGVFRKAQGELMACFERGSKRIPFLAGQVRIAVRVDASGGVAGAHMKLSSLGDRETEQCMLDALRKRSWPKPQGGEVGLAETEFAFDASSDVREPVEWNSADAGEASDQARAVLDQCKRSAGSSALTATLYVKTDGSVMALGLSGPELATESAARCVQDGLRGLKFNSPGSYAAKLVLSD